MVEILFGWQLFVVGDSLLPNLISPAWIMLRTIFSPMEYLSPPSPSWSCALLYDDPEVVGSIHQSTTWTTYMTNITAMVNTSSDCRIAFIKLLSAGEYEAWITSFTSNVFLAQATRATAFTSGSFNRNTAAVTPPTNSAPAENRTHATMDCQSRKWKLSPKLTAATVKTTRMKSAHVGGMARSSLTSSARGFPERHFCIITPINRGAPTAHASALEKAYNPPLPMVLLFRTAVSWIGTDKIFS